MKLNKKHPLYKEDIKNVLSLVDTKQLQGKSFLITGATGMVGVMLIDVLMSIKDVKVYAVGRNKGKAKTRLGDYFDEPRFFFVEQDVCSPFDDSIKVDYIIPMASNTHPLAYSQFPIETMIINIPWETKCSQKTTMDGSIYQIQDLVTTNRNVPVKLFVSRILLKRG